VVELAGLFPLKPVVLLLCLGEDQVGHDEGGNHSEEGLPDSPEDVWQTLREGSGKGFLFHGRQMVLGGAPDGDPEVSEAKTISDKGSPHFISI